MKKILKFLVFLLLLNPFCITMFAQGVNSELRSIALVLRVTGTNKIIQEVELYKTTVFDGKAKNTYGRGSVRTESALHVQVLSDAAEVLIDAYFDNPLNLLLESFQPDGSIERGVVEKEESFVNLRLPLPAGSGTLTVASYQINRENTEQLVSTFQTSYDEK